MMIKGKKQKIKIDKEIDRGLSDLEIEFELREYILDE